nr:hypothetical protein [Tanacetum cinerariifolium]
MAVRVLPEMSSGLSSSIAEVAAMSESTFRKRFRSSYESSLSLSPPDLPSWKRYREDEDPAAGDEGLAAGVEGPDMNDDRHGMDDASRGLDDKGHSVESDGLGLKDEEAVPGGQQQEALVVGIAIRAPLGLGYEALRHRELALEEDHVYNTFDVGQGSGSTPESKRPERVSASRQPTLTTWIDLKDEISIKSLKHEQERTSMTFRALWRPVLALKERAGRVDTRMTDMAWAGYDDHRLVHDMLLDQTSLQRELHEMIGRVTALEQERDRRER